MSHLSVVERTGRVGVDGRVALAGGGITDVELEAEWLVARDEVDEVDTEVEAIEGEVELEETVGFDTEVLVVVAGVGEVESRTSPRRQVETDETEVR